MSRLRITGVPETEHFYLNVSLVNSSSSFQPAIIDQTRTTPILVNPSQYKMTVARFSIPTIAVPLFQFPTNPNGTPNNTAFNVSISYGVNTQVAYVNYLSQEYINVGDIQNAVFSYNNFLLMVNTALSAAFVALTPKPITATPPYFAFDATTQLISLYCSIDYLDFYPFNTPTSMHIGMNLALFKYFEGFDVNYYGQQPGDFNEVSFVVTKTGFNGNKTIDNPTSNVYPVLTNGYVMQCEFKNVSLWDALRKITFTSNTLPVVQEFYQSNTPSGSGSVTRAILTDFEPIIGEAQDARSYQQYQAQLYRWIDLNGTEPLKTIEFAINWTDDMGIIHPLFLPPFSTMDIKILFQRKVKDVTLK